MVVHWSVKSPSVWMCVVNLYSGYLSNLLLFLGIVVLGFGHFGYWFLFSVHICCCCLLAAAVSWLWCVAYLYMVDPAGTWLLNTSTWYLVGTRLPHISSWHMCAQHVFRSTWLYISFDLAGRASYWLWSTMWRLLCIRHRLLSGGYMWCNMDISYFVYMIRLNCVYISSTLSTTFHAQEHCYSLHVSSLAHLLIRTSPCSIPHLHRLYIICQHQMLCHDITVLHATVLVSNLWSS